MDVGKESQTPFNPHQNSEGLWNTEGRPGGREDRSLSQKTWDVVGFAVNLVTFLHKFLLLLGVSLSVGPEQRAVCLCVYIFIYMYCRRVPTSVCVCVIFIYGPSKPRAKVRILGRET